ERVIALLNEGRPPSRGIFSRCTMTTRLWGDAASALRQLHLTVHPTGTITLAFPARYPLIKADEAPAGRVTSSVRTAVRDALSETNQETESGFGVVSGLAAGVEGVVSAEGGGEAFELPLAHPAMPASTTALHVVFIHRVILAAPLAQVLARR
ncbi:MAG TPA: hypothetical protein VIM84_02425, partial [Gemmatimonadales bacterium]